MATTPQILEESELMKSYITTSDADENWKKAMLRLVNITTMATNGISPEEKIQLMTEAIHLLTFSQLSFIKEIDKKIQDSIANANLRQCSNCQAMKYVEEKKKEEEKKQIIIDYKLAHGIKEDEDHDSGDNIQDFSVKSVFLMVKQILVKPYFWVFASILVFSPYGIDIIKLIASFFGK